MSDPTQPAPASAAPTPRRSGSWDDIAREVREKCAERRARVLAHPDIAKRLCDLPMRYPSPEFWTGYIPGPTRGDDRPNNSPIRRQLLSIVQAVYEREQERGS